MVKDPKRFGHIASYSRKNLFLKTNIRFSAMNSDAFGPYRQPVGSVIVGKHDAIVLDKREVGSLNSRSRSQVSLEQLLLRRHAWISGFEMIKEADRDYEIPRNSFSQGKLARSLIDGRVSILAARHRDLLVSSSQLLPGSIACPRPLGQSVVNLQHGRG
jgi:hypothetical protein